MNGIKNGYSLKQISDEIGVNKMKVYRFVKSNHITEQYTNAQTKYYDETVRALIIKEFSDKATDTPNGTNERLENTEIKLIDILNKQIEQQSKELDRKNKQLENKDKQLDKMQELLSQQQQLSLQDKKLIQKYEEENKSLQKLIDVNNEEEREVESKIDQNTEEVPLKKKIWWKFWN